MRLCVRLPPRQFLAAGLLTALALMLPVPPAHALKVQQPTEAGLEAELRHAGLEEPEAAVQEAGRRALQEWLAALPADALRQPTLNAFLKRDDLAEINAYLASLSALDEFLGHPLFRYAAVLPVMVETRHDPSVLDARARTLLHDGRLHGLPSRSEFRSAFHGLLRRAILASPDVQETVSRLLARTGGGEVLQRKRTGQAIAVFLATRRTREATRAFLAALDPETVYGTILTSESLELSLFWYHLTPVYDVLRAQGDSFEQAGQRLVAWAYHFPQFVDDHFLNTYNVYPNDLEWEHWLYEDTARLQRNVNLALSTEIATRLRADGLEESPISEPTPAVVTPEAAPGLEGDRGRIPRGQAPVRLDAAVRALPGGPVTRKELAYLAGVPVDRLHEYQYKARIRRENRRRQAAGIPRIALMRSDTLTAREHLATIRAFLRQHPGGLLRRKTLANAVALSEAQLKHYRPAVLVRTENRRRRAEVAARPAIVYGVGAARWARTERALRAALQALPGGPVSGQLLVRTTGISRTTVRRHDWHRLVQQENARREARGMLLLHVRTRAEVSQEFGQRNHALYQEVEDAIRNALTLHPGGRLRLKALTEDIEISRRTLGAHRWRVTVSKENARRRAAEPWRPLIVPPRPRGSTEGLMRGTVQFAAAGLEEPTGIIVLPEVAELNGVGFEPPADAALSDAAHQVRDYQRML